MSINTINYTLKGVNLDSRATHNFIAHADDVVAEVILRTVYGAEGTCSRIDTRNEDEMAAHNEDFLFDCGGGLFDHHSPADREITYSNGIILSAAGKVLEAAVNDGKVSRFVADYILGHGLYALQAQDNGQDCEEVNCPFQVIGLLSEVGSNFEDLVALATRIFKKLLSDAEAAEQNWPVFQAQLETAENGIIRSEYMSGFGEFACMANAAGANVLFHVFPSIRGGYMGETVKKASGKFADIVSFSQEDKNATDDAIFVHPAGFLCHAETEEGVLKMIESAMARHRG